MAWVDEIIERERSCGVLYGPGWQYKYLLRAPERVRQHVALGRLGPYNAREAVDTPWWDCNPASFTAVTSASATNLWTVAIWTPIPANDAIPGKNYKIAFGGIYSNRTVSTPASTWTPRWGQSSTPASNTTLGASAAVYSGAALTNNPFFGEFTLAIRTVGTSGTGTGNGFVMRGAASGIIRQPIGGTVATIDTTVAAGLIIDHIWSATNASNTLTCQWVILKDYL